MKTQTPPKPYSALQKDTFAFTTIGKRLPDIMGKIIDSCQAEAVDMRNMHGQQGVRDCGEVVGKLTELRKRLVNDECLEELKDDFVDAEDWKNLFKHYTEELGEKPTWFKAPWYYVESYMYRYVYSCLHSSTYMKNFDPFSCMKEDAYNAARPAVEELSAYLIEVCKEKLGEDELRELFLVFLQMSLWANKSDLSLSLGSSDESVRVNPRESVTRLKSFILADQSKDVWEYLQARRNKITGKVRIDIVLDNAGVEFFTDLVLAEFLLSARIADEVVFQPKAIPWYVSDVIPGDLTKLYDLLSAWENDDVTECVNRFKNRFDSGQMRMESDQKLIRFYSLGRPFHEMKDHTPELYQQLRAESSLVVFKGDLNYRKLVGDLNWEHTATFEQALMGFRPAPALVSLRTVKADVVVGLKEGQAEECQKEDSDWKITGKYGLIQSLISS